MAGGDEKLFVLAPLNFKGRKARFPTKSSFAAAEEVGKYDPLIFCRTCANMDSCLVPIFKEEGLDYSLNKKIEKYLPIQVSEEDDLPVHLCYHCASTLIAWDNLLVGCIEAERKLTLLKNSLEDKSFKQGVEDVESLANENLDSDDEPLIIKKESRKTKSTDEKRDVLQEKNVLHTSESAEVQSERLMEEPDLSFSTYRRQLPKCRHFAFQVLRLRIENPFCCDTCSAVNDLKVGFLKSSSDSKVSGKTEEERDGSVARDKWRKRSKWKDRAVCDVCGAVLSGPRSLKKHAKTHREDKKSFDCDLCGKAFGHRFSLLRHLTVVHEGVRNHVCPDCGRRYRSHGEMEDHRNVHVLERKIICEECGRAFLTKASFYPHKKSHRTHGWKKEPGAFGCEECHKKFTSRKSRDQHRLIHTGEKPIGCTACGKKFRTKANLAQHAKVHSGVKPHACEHCGKAFGRRDHLRIHVRSHTGEKPYVCDCCGRGFAQANDLKKHSRIHGKIV